MFVSQAIRSALGVSAFGSAVVRVAPDVALLQFAASRLDESPAKAFKEAREAAHSVRDFLVRSNVTDIRASRITLTQKWDYRGSVSKLDGYVASAAFNVLVEDLEQLESILCGVVDAGANEINRVQYQTRNLKEQRANARRLAAAAAKEKAIIYADCLGKGVGDVLHIEDVNPDLLQTRGGHLQQEDPQFDDEGPVKAFDPGSISVGAAVMVVFDITDQAAS